MISQLQKLNYIVNISAPCDGTPILKRQAYYCNEPSKKFTLFFPQVTVNVHKVLITTGKDVYPVSWQIKISKSGQTFQTLKESNEPTCRKENQAPYYSRSTYCTASQSEVFDISTRNDQHAKYVKFSMLSNTYHESSSYTSLIYFVGFDLIGNFFDPNKNHTLKMHVLNAKSFIYALIILLIN